MELSFMAVTPEHKDILGQPLALGDCVVFPSSNSMYIGTVIKLNNKMVKVKRIGAKTRYGEINKYPADLARVSGAEVTMYLLKHQSSS
jgi:hypothetical protein